MTRNRRRMLTAARELLSRGIAELSMDAVARQAKVTRQTVYNQFGSSTALLETLFGEIASKGGMEGIAAAFRQRDPAATLTEYIKVFAKFWSSDRELTRRIHNLAAVHPDLENVLAARQQRRMGGTRKIVSMLSARYGIPASENIEDATRVLYSLTSFEFFDSMAGTNRTPEQIAPLVIRLASAFLGISLGGKSDPTPR